MFAGFVGFLSLLLLSIKGTRLLTTSHRSRHEVDDDSNVYQFLERLIIWHLLVKKKTHDRRVREDVEVLKLERHRNPSPLGPAILVSTKQPGKCFFLNK